MQIKEKKILTKLLQMIEELTFQDEFYTWSDKPENSLLTIDWQFFEHDITTESIDSSDEGAVITLAEDQPIDLTI